MNLKKFTLDKSKLHLLKLKQGINKKIVQPFVIINRCHRFNLSPITIISSDCSGGVLCHDYGLPLDSPTVNLIIDGADFNKFCKNLDVYLKLDLIDNGRQLNTNYPIALCGDIKIIGVHYCSFQELSEAWDRRKTRVHNDKTVFLLTERQVKTRADFYDFSKIKGRKLFLCSKKFNENADFVVKLNEFDRMFLFEGVSGHRYIDKEFNFAEWYLK